MKHNTCFLKAFPIKSKINNVLKQNKNVLWASNDVSHFQSQFALMGKILKTVDNPFTKERNALMSSKLIVRKADSIQLQHYS